MKSSVMGLRGGEENKIGLGKGLLLDQIDTFLRGKSKKRSDKISDTGGGEALVAAGMAVNNPGPHAAYSLNYVH